MTTLIHMFYNCTIITFSLFSITVKSEIDFEVITMITLLVLALFQLGIYCHYGQKIMDQVYGKSKNCIINFLF